MRTRLCALLLAGLLLVPLPVFAAPDRAEVEAASPGDGLLARFARVIAGWFGPAGSTSADLWPDDRSGGIKHRSSPSEEEGDLGPGIDPDGLTEPPPPPPEEDLGPGIDPDG